MKRALEKHRPASGPFRHAPSSCPRYAQLQHAGILGGGRCAFAYVVNGWEGRWKTALAERRLAEGSDDVMSPDAGVVVPEDGRGGVAWRSRTKGTPGAWFCSPGRAMTRLCLCLAGFLLAAGLAVLAAAPAHADPLEDGDLRLRGGASHNEGRLEIYHDSEWGTVCDDFFRRVDAKVACKQMGYTGAEAVLTDVAVALGKRFWLDDVNCVGDEDELTKCFYNSSIRNSSSRTSDILTFTGRPERFKVFVIR